MAKFLAVVLVLAYLVATSAGWCFGISSHKKYERVLGGMTNGEIFRALDKNQDGILTLDDWILDGGQEKDFKELADKADGNKDDKITFAEFKTIKNLVVKP